MKKLCGFFTGGAALVGSCVLLSAAPASADCFELIGCTDSGYFRQSDLRQLSCEYLWYVRNRIYDENGYCFQTPRGRSNFDNSDCWTENQAAVSLNQYEQTNVNRIVGVENEKSC